MLTSLEAVAAGSGCGTLCQGPIAHPSSDGSRRAGQCWQKSTMMVCFRSPPSGAVLEAVSRYEWRETAWKVQGSSKGIT